MARFQHYLKEAKELEFPHYRQAFDWNCGTTSMNMILSFYGHDVREDGLIKISKATPEEGAPIEGLKDIARKYGLKFKEGTFTTNDLKRHIDMGWPTLLMIQAWSTQDNPDWANEWDQGHYTVCVGYDDNRLFFADPSSIHKTYIPIGALNSRWHGWDDNGKKINKWGIVFTNKSKFSFKDEEEVT